MKAQVTLPDGTTTTVEGPSRQSILDQANELGRQTSRRREVSTGDALALGALTTFLDNWFEVPEDVANVVGEGLARGAAAFLGPGMQKAGQKLRGADFPNPTAQDAFALAQQGGEAAGFVRQKLTGGATPPVSSFGEAKRQQTQRVQQTQQERPVAFGAGGMVGDAATIMAGRAPFVKGRIFKKAAGKASDAGGLRAVASDIIRTRGSRSLGNAMKKAGEAGIEGAAHAIMNDANPFEVAAMGAGGSLVGSVGQQVFPSSKIGSLGFLGLIGGTWALARLGQEFAPGENNAYDALDISFSRAQDALLVGAVSGLTGFGGRLNGPRAGPIRQSITKNLPKFADAVTAIPRNAVLSLASRLNAEGVDGPTAESLQSIMADPAGVPADVRRRLEKAVREDTLPETLDKLRESGKL